MTTHERVSITPAEVRILRIDAVAQGITMGSVAGLVVALATIWLVVKGGPVVGPNLALLSQFFWGYRVTWFGSIIGFAWAFAYGFVAGYLVSRIYNLVVERRHA